MTNDTPGRWQRIVVVSAAICAVVAVALAFWRPLVALGFVGGVVTGAGSLGALVVVLNRIAVPSSEATSRAAPWMVLHVGKFILVAAFAYLVVVTLGGSVLAFAGGYTIALVALVVIIAFRPTMSDSLSQPEDTSSEEEPYERKED